MAIGAKFTLAPTADYDFHIGGGWQIGCCEWYPKDLIDNIAAAAIAYQAGYASIDYAKKHFCGERDLIRGHDSILRDLFAQVDKWIVNSFQEMQPRTDTSFRTVSFDQAFVRALGTLKRALYLASRGYVFKTALVARGFVEQVAWALSAIQCSDESQLLKINIHKSITNLKSVYPTVGFVYGLLSKFAHFDARRHNLFYAEKDGVLATRFGDAETKIISTSWLFSLIDLYYAVFEFAYAHAISHFRVLSPTVGFIGDRPALTAFNLYFEDYDEEVQEARKMFA